ncbi:MAG: lipid-A-disaccharide synthase [Bacteroidetes bacterium]|nr:lipid-A-disaccharide synthase [Bacteroidota bacterium]MBS1591166.1 lipid-A-disaccharide synthase [Bacteroidota bacterium]
MKYYIISGEASGDLHGSNLIKQLLLLDESANVHCWGGDLMQAAGAKLIKHYKELAFMGFAEVVKNLPTIFRNIKFCKQDITNFKPDVLVLIDYPGFNLRIAEWAKQQGYKVVYYISPQVWAWKENRVKKMKLCIDKMLCILPFEKKYYETKWNWNVEYVGHPLVEVIEEYKKKDDRNELADDRKKNTEDRIQEIGEKNESLSTSYSPLTPHDKEIIALLPGSRKQEIAKKLPIMLEVSKSFSNYQFIVAQAPGQDDDFYKPFLQPYNNVSSIKNNTYHLLMQSTVALVTSGTATLETALFAVPEVVCYKGGNISYQIAKRLIKIKYISLVNLIMDKLVVKELIQNDLTVANIIKELSELLNNTIKQQQLQKDYADLKSLLSSGGNASAKAAAIIYNFAKCN